MGTLKGSSFIGKKDHRAFLVSSQVSDSPDSTPPVISCFQEFIVSHQLKMCSSLVSRKGNGVKVEFIKGLPFVPKSSAPKFIDP
jgi:hypothetical protein